ncbi:MAG: STAS domain-containing protein [Nocardiaceae bacterium]|nr:STAS domain-containing protein [Nocardiaceae bacterium]
MIEFSTHKNSRGITVVHPEGRLNMVAAPKLRELIIDLISAGETQIVVELSSTEFIDSSGLGALISGLKAARQAGGDLRLAAPTAQVDTVLSLTNLNRVLKPYPSADRAFDGD